MALPKLNYFFSRISHSLRPSHPSEIVILTLSEAEGEGPAVVFACFAAAASATHM
jgi:hypothetical protein